VESFRWGPRAIDIDILLYDGVTMDSENLTIPHARLHERKFALIPLLELDFDLTLPDGRRIRDLAESRELAGQSIHKLDAAMRRGAAAME
jgi:2-amino-4-hydroxy-6-hydroxymethyldihydropteridine diphosphokinase